MKKRSIIAIVFIFAFGCLGFASCGTSNNGDSSQTVIKVGVTDADAEVIWGPTVDAVAKEGIKIEFVSFSDYPLPNRALNDGEIQLNAFQHIAYLNAEVKANGYKIKEVGATYYSPLNVYSEKVKNVKDLQNNATIAIPNDVTNEGRALKVLQEAGLIKIKKSAGFNPTPKDIASNPKNIQIKELDAAQIAPQLKSVDAAIINASFAINYHLSPANDAIFRDNPKKYDSLLYKNVIVAQDKDANDSAIQKIVKAYQSQATIDIYNTKYSGAFIPAW